MRKLIERYRRWRRTRAMYNGIFKAREHVALIGVEQARMLYAAATAKSKRDFFDYGYEFVLVQHECMRDGNSATLTINGKVIGRCDDYGVWHCLIEE